MGSTELKSIGLKLMELKSTDLALPEISMATVIKAVLPFLIVALALFINRVKKKREEKANESKDIAELRVTHDMKHNADVEALKKSRWGG